MTTMANKVLDISWAQFEVCNANQQVSFENMCRWLFNVTFFDGKALLHSDPNNPGIEVLPELCLTSNKNISFQSKYFSTNVDYSQIKKSAKKAIEHYSGKLDIIYLYCNKDVTTSCKQYSDIESKLNEANIEIIPVCNQTILEQVMSNESIAWYYFNQITLSKDWFTERLNLSLDSLGPRYNNEFNVHTHTEDLFNYFLCNELAAININKRKKDVLNHLKNNRWRYRFVETITQKFIDTISSLEDVNSANISDCVHWSNTIETNCADEILKLGELTKAKNEEFKNAINDKKADDTYNLSAEIRALEYLSEIPKIIGPDNHIISLLTNQALVIKGNTGSGKSQLLAVATENLINSNKAAILLLGTNYLSNNTIFQQTIDTLNLNLLFDSLLHKLEIIGAQNNCYSYIFIDALNESPYKNIWLVGLTELITKIKKFPHIKLAVSIRSGYEHFVLNENIQEAINSNTIASIVHNGFREESIEATRTFLNHYGIPFLPSYFLQTEMTNPLFLSLFCKTYTGENFDIYTLFEKLIEKAEIEALNTINMSGAVSVLHYLIKEIAEVRLSTGYLLISQADLFNFKFWDTYGLSNKKLEYISSLERSGLLIAMPYGDTESYYLGYNLLEDFVCARTILNRYTDLLSLTSYIVNELLAIEDGCITHNNNIDIFIILCGLYADKYHQELIEDIEMHITDESDKHHLSSRYIESFLWRKASSVNADIFMQYIKTHSIYPNLVFSVLIENSAKENHPLNAMYLHSVLWQYTLPHRDSLWTTFVNDITYEDRLFQIIANFDEGNTLDGLSTHNTELLLILFTWLFTSSNRYLRDKASKACIELLKNYFELCKPLLQRFEKVNDPYVIQRLYGVVFGACVKRIEPYSETYKELAEYVYKTIFDQSLVYPDVLLRDYARLILERYMYEYPDDSNFIEVSKITPPYKSKQIPTVSKQEYYHRDDIYNGFNLIDNSMIIDHHDVPGMYGDFGRYTFQSALQNFDGIDIVNIYHYAMQFIRDELGYSNELLSDYDTSARHYSYVRNTTKKIERIGKKYQWIALYNILARISDSHLLKDYNTEPYSYEGPWEPYVRCFDPTLNVNSMNSKDIPLFEPISYRDEFLSTESNNQKSDILNWTNTECQFFAGIPSKLLVKDNYGNMWIALHLHDKIKNKTYKFDSAYSGFSNGSQQIWTIANAFFIKPEQFRVVKEYVNSSKFNNIGFPDSRDVYQLYNREFPWSSGYKSIFKEEWIDFEIESDKYHIEKVVYDVPDYENATINDEGIMNIKFIQKEFERKVPDETITIQVMPTFLRYIWESEYDASQEESTAFNIPCKDLIEHLKIEQKHYDGCYYSKNGELACFDGAAYGLCDGLFIRADFVEKYLNDKGVILCWTCIGEKQYFLGSMNQKYSRWNGFYHLEKGRIVGKINITDSTTN